MINVVKRANCHIVLFMFASILAACRNDIADIRAITDKNTKPVQTSYNASYTFSEKGLKQTRLEAGLLEQYKVEGEDDYIVASGGFKMIFFDSLQLEEARVTADSGRYEEKKKTLMARGNVLLLNTQGEKLETEELIFDQDSALIYTDKRVKITLSGGTVLHGLGLRSNDNFTRYRIIKPTGDLVLDEDQNTDHGENQ